MKKPWSITTTLRNPERLRDFLLALKLLEGEMWSSANQEKYQILLIQHRYYGYGSQQFYNGLTTAQIKLIDDPEKTLSFQDAQAIFNRKDYNDPPHRGRESFNPLKKLGLASVINGKVVITSLGEYLLSDNYDLGELFFRSFIKWQLPNLDNDDYNVRDGYSIKPFIGTLHLINEVNKKWESLGNKPVGITKEEFSLFAPTLINYEKIIDQAAMIVDFRKELSGRTTDNDKKAFREKFKKQYASAFLGSKKPADITSLLNNLKDYGDNAIRYFRLTRYIYIRGGGFHVDLEPRRHVEISRLLESDNSSPLDFPSVDEYRSYISDINLPILPWEERPQLEKISAEIIREITDYSKSLSEKGINIPAIPLRNTDDLDKEALKKYIEELRSLRRTYQNIEIQKESRELTKIEEYISSLKQIHRSSAKKSIELERLATLALVALNDALEIKPNYPVGDDNEPTFTAPANKPDIECYYDSFYSVCEVTMLMDRSQWYNEGQPVMRHVRDFEKAHSDKKVYCLFVSPKVHQDTAETFWMSIKYGYKGAKQRIIPLSITQLVHLLEVLLEFKRQGKKMSHNDLLKLYDDILGMINDVEHSDEWIAKIPSAIDKWQESILV